MKLLLHVDQLSERGTSTAIYEYAKIIQSLGFQATVAWPASAKQNNPQVIHQFKNEFEVFPYRSFREVLKSENHFDLGYFLKFGVQDKKLLRQSPNIVHAVFPVYEPHGQIYLYVSEWLANSMKSKFINKSVPREVLNKGLINPGKFEYLPHAVHMPHPTHDLRVELKIPTDATVITRYGGYATFDLDWVKEEISRRLRSDKNFWFIGANTKPFDQHHRLIYLPPIIDKQDKSNFLATGNVFLHARNQGETFGISIVESLQVGTPVLSWSGGVDQNHKVLLGEMSLYQDVSDLAVKLDLLREGSRFSASMPDGNQFRPQAVSLEIQKLIGRLGKS